MAAKILSLLRKPTNQYFGGIKIKEWVDLKPKGFTLLSERVDARRGQNYYPFSLECY